MGNSGAARKLTVRDLLNFYETYRYDVEVQNRPGARAFVIWLYIAKHFLGDKWIGRNLTPNTGRGFMRLRLDQTVEAEIQAARLWDLAELLINLQHIDGFDELIERMKTAEAESSLAELHVGRLLYINDAQFKFVVPKMKKKGEDYDLEITYPDGLVVCGETKCKIESTQLTAKTIENALRAARGQLPEDKPGIVFLKFPQQWFEGDQKSSAERLMVETAIAFFRGEPPRIPRTTRVVSVKYYVEPLSWANGIVGQGHLFKEVSNPHNKFNPTRNWSLFHYRPTTDHWNKLPAKWIRLVNFPDELGIHGQI